MISAPKHPREHERLKALRDLDVLDTLPEKEFDEITFLASTICETPIALVSLVDENRQWFKSKVGLSADQTPRDVAFCAHAILQDELFLIEHSRGDDRFHDNPLVTGGPNVEFYAGVPIVDPVHNLPIGTLCVIDQKPCTLTPEQRKALEALRNQVQRVFELRLKLKEQMRLKRKLEQAQHVAKLGSWEYDVERKTITWSDQLFEMMFEGKVEGPIDLERHMASVHPEDLTVWKSAFNGCLQNGRPYFLRFRRQISDRLIWVDTMVQGVFENNRLVALTGTCQDVTDRVLIENQLEAQRLEAIQNAKMVTLGEMSAGVAHEINNPLAIIATNLPLIRKNHKDEEKVFKKLDAIDKAVGRIARIVQGLRKFSRSSGDLQQEHVSLVELIGETLVLIEVQSQRHSVRMDLDLNSRGSILCNSNEIQQVLINLIGNAIDAAAQSEGRWVQVKSFDETDAAVIQIIDSGSGVPADIQSKIFQPFFTTKPVGQGTGLGLSISKGILDNHNAILKLVSGAKNTCFEIRFPKASITTTEVA